MNSNRLDTFHRGSEVRHLLLEGEDHGARKLTTLINGVRTEMATGTTYEMDKQSHTVMEEWRKEGFKYRRDEDHQCLSRGKMSSPLRNSWDSPESFARTSFP